MKKRNSTIIVILIIILLLVGAAYWYFFLRGPSGTQLSNGSGITTGFNPFGGSPSTPGRTGSQNTASTTGSNSQTGNGQGSLSAIPTLRLLSNSPVGGYGSMTNSSTTIVRWVDRGRGNIYEISEYSLNVNTLSNTIVPMMYASSWNNGLTAFIGSMLNDSSDNVSTVYASLVPQTAPAATSTDQVTQTPYQLKGKNLPSTIKSFAISPDKSKIFLFSIENGRGIGYVAPFNGGAATEIFDTPITQVNVEWPETNTIAITTKGSAAEAGFLYFVDPKSGVWTKILGPLPGLSTKVSRDAKYVIASVSGNNQNVLTSIYNVSKGTGIDAVIRTLADKCVWGNFYKNMVYCAVPSQPTPGTYPDDWYKGTLSTIDKIWQVNADTGEVHLISSIVDQSDRVIDTFNLGLDDKDNYLFFMNKNDLSLWSLDLVSND